MMQDLLEKNAKSKKLLGDHEPVHGTGLPTERSPYDIGKKYGLLDLLPQSQSAIVNRYDLRHRILNLVVFFSSIITEAIEALIGGEYELFDPHVGECLCQIRACMVWSIAKKHISGSLSEDLIGILHTCKATQARARSLLSSLNKRVDISDKNLTLSQYIENNQLDIFFGKYLYVLTLSYFLTKYQKRTTCFSGKAYRTIINYLDIQSDSGMAKSLFRKIVHNYQIYLSEVSCSFVECKASGQLPVYGLSSILTLLTRRDDDNRLVLPCHLATDILLSDLIEKKAIVKLEITRALKNQVVDTLNFFCIGSDHGFEFINSNLIDARSPCVVIEGITEYNNSYTIESKEELLLRIRKVGLSEIVSCYMAAHPQYAGEKLKFLNKSFEEILSRRNTDSAFLSGYGSDYISKKGRAKEMGCTDDNPSLFFIRHIYCGPYSKKHP